MIKKIKKSKKAQIMEPEETKTDTKDTNGPAQAYVSRSFQPPSPLQKGFKKLGVGLMILATLVGIGWFLNQQGFLSKIKLSLFSPPTFFSPSPVPTTSPLAQVTITAKGFIPQTILVKKGSTVNWANTDNKPHQVSSDPHPTHSLLPALGKGQLLPAGSSFTLTFDRTGTFTYHDEENPLKFKGVVIVK